MRFSLTNAVAAALTLFGTAAALTTGPFYITIVPEDGSAAYPATIATVSRGAQILSSALTYDTEFIFNVTADRLVKAAETNLALGSGALTVGAPLLFAQTTGAALAQVTISGETYLVQSGTTDINQWWSSPTTTGLPVEVDWEGPGSDGANAALRIDLTV
ncbi:Uu.00g100410.m01.CDS01 [Anthostomella pinea]|uniref:Uu.00g100410.m01.CDS01 n=1 Tax=Anthostomella pinea TaxID=933095 RepID=A0AAI8VDZ9_9PEZI|nr:Uu.00g100410.m01.CDS01 [Anthostomella pinea]